MQFVIFHGAFGNPEANWFPELKEKLEILGQDVLIPQFPVDTWEEITNKGPAVRPQNQILTNWLQTFEKLLPQLKRAKNLCFVGHSLGPLCILHVVEKFNLQLNSAIFVSPFLRKLGKSWQIDHVNNSFYKTDFDFERLRQLISISYVVYGNDDPYVNKDYSLEFAQKLGSSPILVTRGGHLSSEVNLNEFPLVLELCKTRLDMTLYQKYLAHRRELYAVDYARKVGEEIVYLDPKDVFDEGVFHFRNLKRGGFCTFYTALRFWDTQSVYMEEARKAARRVPITRVFIVDALNDLKRKKLRQQIELDFEAGINVYLCFLYTIKNASDEYDFGIWDDDYVCYVQFNRKRQVDEVRLSSRKQDIKKAHEWQRVILKKAVRVNQIDKDLKNFIQR